MIPGSKGQKSVIIKGKQKQVLSLRQLHRTHFHHTFATRGLEQGIPLKVMQSILGHSSLAITADLYSHVLPNTKAEEMKKLESVL